MHLVVKKCMHISGAIWKRDPGRGVIIWQLNAIKLWCLFFAVVQSSRKGSSSTQSSSPHKVGLTLILFIPFSYMSETKCSTMFHSITGNLLLFHAVSTILEANLYPWKPLFSRDSLSQVADAQQQITTASPRPKAALHQWLSSVQPYPNSALMFVFFSEAKGIWGLS